MQHVVNVKAENAALIQREVCNNVSAARCFPSTVILSPSQKCNYRCRTCMQKHGSDELPAETLRKVEAIMPYVTLLDFVGGEPLLLDSFRQVIGWGSQYSCRLETVTNGVLLDATWRELFVENLHNVRISVDAAKPETYRYIRRANNFFKVLRNIGELALLKLRRQRATPVIEINFVAMRANIRELPKLVALAGELGVDIVKVIYMLAHNEELAKQSLYFMQEESDTCMRIAKEVGARAGVEVQVPGFFCDAAAGSNPVPRSLCGGPWHFLGVDADGSAEVCCGGAPSFGNLNRQDFRDFWQAPALQALRRTINTPAQPAYCTNCAHCGDNLRRVDKHIIRPGLAAKAAAALGVPLPEADEPLAAPPGTATGRVAAAAARA